MAELKINIPNPISGTKDITLTFDSTAGIVEKEDGSRNVRLSTGFEFPVEILQNAAGLGFMLKKTWEMNGGVQQLEDEITQNVQAFIEAIEDMADDEEFVTQINSLTPEMFKDNNKLKTHMSGTTAQEDVKTEVPEDSELDPELQEMLDELMGGSRKFQSDSAIEALTQKLEEASKDPAAMTKLAYTYLDTDTINQIDTFLVGLVVEVDEDIANALHARVQATADMIANGDDEEIKSFLDGDQKEEAYDDLSEIAQNVTSQNIRQLSEDLEVALVTSGRIHDLVTSINGQVDILLAEIMSGQFDQNSVSRIFATAGQELQQTTRAVTEAFAQVDKQGSFDLKQRIIEGAEKAVQRRDDILGGPSAPQA